MKFFKSLLVLCVGIQAAAAENYLTYVNVEGGLGVNLKFGTLGEAYPSVITIPDMATDPTTGAQAPVVEIGLFNGAEMETVKFGSNIVRIGNSAFSGCSKLKNVGTGNGFSLPQSVQTIGSSAFADCSSLFVNTSDVVVNVPVIHDLAFANTGMSNFTFGPDVTVSSMSVVKYNPGLRSVTFAKAASDNDKFLIERGGYYPGREDTPIPVIYLNRPLYSDDNPDSYVTIEVPGLNEVHVAYCPEYRNFFKGTSSNSTNYDLYIGPGVKTVGPNTICRNLFSENATDLEKITYFNLSGAREDFVLDLTVFPSLAKITSSFNSDAISYSTVTLPEALTYFDSSFQNTTVNELVIPEGPALELGFGSTDVDRLIVYRTNKIDVYHNVLNATVVEYGPKVTTVYGIPSDKLEKLLIPESVTEIADNAFSNCAALKTIIGAKGVTTIGDWAFSGCTSLEAFNLSYDLTSIGEWSFSGAPIKALTFHDQIRVIPSIFGYDTNPNLRALSFGRMVEETDYKLFSNMPNLAYVRHTALLPPTVPNMESAEAESDFTAAPFTTCMFLCPTEAVDVYKAAPFWQHFFEGRHSVTIDIEGMGDYCSIVVTPATESREGDETDSALLMPVSNGETITVAPGSSVTLRFDMPQGAQINELSVDGTDVSSQVTDNEFTITDIRADKSVSGKLSVPSGIQSTHSGNGRSIVSNGSGSIMIEGADGKAVSIYTVDGICLFATGCYQSESINGLPAGVCIAVVDGNASKFAVK